MHYVSKTRRYPVNVETTLLRKLCVSRKTLAMHFASTPATSASPLTVCGTVRNFLFIAVLSLLAVNGLRVSADSPVIRFDLPPAVALTSDQTDTTRVVCELRLSSMIASAEAPKVDQWIVRCQPRSRNIMIADYAPKTETSSDVDGPIQIKVTKESTNSIGASINGDYGKFVHGHVGADNGSKTIHSQQYNKIAPVSAVTASGSINRGRGVYFKLRWTAEQILEGEKVFRLVLQIPRRWRGGLMDVSVIAQSHRSLFGGWDQETRTVGGADFVVAMYRSGDEKAERLAHEIASAEQRLKNLSSSATKQSRPQSLPSMLRHVAAKLDFDTPRPSDGWLQRLMSGQADPYMDKDISRLPIDIRVAAIDYHNARNAFVQLTGRML